MITWLIALPVLAAVSAGIVVELRRHPRGCIRAVKVLNLLLLLGAGVLVILAASAPAPSAAATGTAATAKPYAGQALIGAAIAVAGSSIGAAITVSVHRICRTGSHQRGAPRCSDVPWSSWAWPRASPSTGWSSPSSSSGRRNGLMGQVVVLGESARVMGYALAGAVTMEAEGEEVARTWALLPSDTSLVVLTPAAARALGQAVVAERATP